MFFLLFSLFYTIYYYFWLDGAKLRINFQSAKCFSQAGRLRSGFARQKPGGIAPALPS